MESGFKMAKKKKYDITKLVQTGANYLIPLGKRSNGKTYQVRKKVLEDAYTGRGNFVYLRRYRDDIKQSYVQSWFEDENFNIEDVTEGNYNTVICWQGFIFFGKYDEETGKTEKGARIGRYCALNEDYRYKSQSFPHTINIVYEEFVTDGIYLNNEPNRLQQFVSTVFRDDKGSVFLIGNTLSRVCPYFYEWGLSNTLRQPQGTIEIYNKHMQDSHGNDVIVKIAVENCNNDGVNSGMFFGQTAKQIVSGEWDVEPFPRLPKALEEYDDIYKLSVCYQDFIFGLQLLCDENGAIYLYVSNMDKPFDDFRIIQEDFSDDIKITSSLDNRSKAEMKMRECFKNNKTCYSDDLTGTDFKNVLAQFPIF